MLLSFGVGEDSWESLGLQGDPVKPKGNQSWIFIGRTDGEAETPILWLPDVKNWLIGKDPDVEKDWRREEGDDRGWDDWMASPTQWTWVWVNSKSWWWAGRPGVLQFMGSQSDKSEQLNWTEEYSRSLVIWNHWHWLLAWYSLVHLYLKWAEADKNYTNCYLANWSSRSWVRKFPPYNLIFSHTFPQL